MTTEDAIAKWSPFRDELKLVPHPEDGGPEETPPSSTLPEDAQACLDLAAAHFKCAHKKLDEAQPYFEMGQRYYELAKEKLDAS